VSVSTTGVSAIIDNHGVVIAITKQNQADFIDSEVLLIQKASIAQRVNGYSAIFIVVLSVVLYLRKKKMNV
jgi:apolipoprotein N-acyltransferase